MDELVFATAQEMAAAIRRRRVSAVEVLDEHLAQIARHNPALNAIVTLDEERSQVRAREADVALARGECWGPLHGVPVTIKDSLETAGLRTTAGHPPLAGYVPSQDAPTVARLRGAGAIILGKTNLPELAMDVQSANPIFGRSNNPWDLERTPGGSTGGGAAAVAAGMSPLTLGSDAGGSVRIPAHYCGIFSLKPTEHRVPTTGHIPELPGAPRGLRHLVTIGPMARSVEDLALTLQLIAGPDGRQWEVPPVPLEPVLPRDLASLRLAWTDELGGVPVTQGTRAALAGLVQELETIGVAIEQRTPDGFDFDTTWKACVQLFEAEISPSAFPEVAAKWTIQEYTHLLTKRDALIGMMERYFDSWDALLVPVTSGPALSHCTSNSPIFVDGREVDYWQGTAGYTFPFNLTGHPAVVLPLLRYDGLPIGVQVVGRRWEEIHLLSVAKALSEVTGPFQRPPGYDPLSGGRGSMAFAS